MGILRSMDGKEGSHPFVFDVGSYLRENPDIARQGIDPFVHWITCGRSEERHGLRKNYQAPHFDGEYYSSLYPDVKDLIENNIYASGAEHWKMSGMSEVATGNRSIDPGFDHVSYLNSRPDVAAAIGGNDALAAYDHWLCWGRYELGISGDHKPKPRPSIISSEKSDFWARNGYMILEGLISPERCEAVNGRMDQLWDTRWSGTLPVSIDIYIDRDGARRIPFTDAPADARHLPYKLNDLVMHDDIVGGVALDEKLCDGLEWVLGDKPVAIGSLNFERGSTQEFHTDTLYMPGDTPGGMTAAWIALEDVSSQAGPLFYYPGSHNIPLFLFSDGRPHQRLDEFQNYRDYMYRNVADMQLVPEAFLPKKGDVLIWHEKLFHAGGAIKDMSLTRKSLVVHYWRHADMRDKILKKHGGGYFWNRPPLT